MRSLGRTVWWILGGVVLMLSAWQLVAAAEQRLVERVVVDSVAAEVGVALTFDDGPFPGATDSVLAVLRRHEARATFFLVGERARLHPDLVRRIIAEGHEVGNHGLTHTPLRHRLPSSIRHEVLATDSILGSLGAAAPRPFRAPYGASGVSLSRLLHAHGRADVRWTVAPERFDGRPDSAARIVREALRTLRPGSILLLHPEPPSRQATLQALPLLLDSLSARGFQVGPLPPAAAGLSRPRE